MLSCTVTCHRRRYRCCRCYRRRRINVEVWGPLAERADQVLSKGDRVAVQGRLKVDKWEDRATGAKRTAYKVVASSLSKVRRSSYPAGQFGEGGEEAAGQFGGGGGYGDAADAAKGGGAQAAPWDPPAQQQQQQQEQQGGGAGQQTSEELWMDFFENPSGALRCEWRGEGGRKGGRRGGTVGGLGGRTQVMLPSPLVSCSAALPHSPLCAPAGWYDNRINKRNPKAPDFKKKEGGREGAVR